MHNDYTNVERLAELQRLEQTIAEARGRIREMTGQSLRTGRDAQRISLRR